MPRKKVRDHVDGYLDPTPSPEPPDAFYDSARSQFWMTKLTLTQLSLEYTPAPLSALRLYLRELGHNPNVPTDQKLSQVEEQILHIMREKDVSYAGPLAGYRAGVCEDFGPKILVTRSPNPIAPRKGAFPTIERMLEGQFPERDQLVIWNAWCKCARESLDAGEFRPGHVLVLAGEAGSGKSLLQSLITLILGGRSAKPYRYMTGNTQFNSDLFGAEHLIIEDEAASTDLRTRRAFGAHIKNLVANPTQSFHAKGRDAMSLSPFWRVSMSLNNDPESLMVMPFLDKAILEKMIMLLVHKPAVFDEVDSLDKRKKFYETLVDELPAYLHFLKRWRLPKRVKGGRYGMIEWHHPELISSVRDLTPEQRLLELLQLFQFGDLMPWVGTAQELERELRSKDSVSTANLLTFSSACGTYLGRLKQQHPEAIGQTKSRNAITWSINLRMLDPRAQESSEE